MTINPNPNHPHLTESSHSRQLIIQDIHQQNSENRRDRGKINQKIENLSRNTEKEKGNGKAYQLSRGPIIGLGKASLRKETTSGKTWKRTSKSRGAVRASEEDENKHPPEAEQSISCATMAALSGPERETQPEHSHESVSLAEQAVQDSRLCVDPPEGAWLAIDASCSLSWRIRGSIVEKLLSLYKTNEESTPLGKDGANVISSIEGEHKQATQTAWNRDSSSSSSND